MIVLKECTWWQFFWLLYRCPQTIPFAHQAEQLSAFGTICRQLQLATSVNKASVINVQQAHMALMGRDVIHVPMQLGPISLVEKAARHHSCLLNQENRNCLYRMVSARSMWNYGEVEVAVAVAEAIKLRYPAKIFISQNREAVVVAAADLHRAIYPWPITSMSTSS